MSSLHDLIKKIQVEKANHESYVYYDKDTGKIHKISSSKIPDDTYEIITLSNEEVKPILTGERRTEEFIIIYDLSIKQIRLKEVEFDDSYNTADAMTYLLPMKKERSVNTVIDAVSILTTPVYVGIYIDVWYKELSHLAGQHVWYKNTVYKFKKDQTENTNFKKSNCCIIVENVKLYSDANKLLQLDNDITTGDIILNNNNLYKVNDFKNKKASDIRVCQNINQERSVNTVIDAVSILTTPVYVGIYIDVWYKELSHLAGQHVWYKNTVYKFKKDQTENTNFKKSNCCIIVENVKLYSDANKLLQLDNDITTGDIILNNNNLYKVNDFKNKKASDIRVCQNINQGVWELELNLDTKRFLRRSGYNPKETLYFSVTSKFDPNILYRSLECIMSDLLSDVVHSIPFKYDIEYSEADVSIYTAKYFENYSHEVING